MDINALMNMAKNVQERMQEAQAEASKVRVEGLMLVAEWSKSHWTESLGL